MKLSVVSFISFILGLFIGVITSAVLLDEHYNKRS